MMTTQLCNLVLTLVMGITVLAEAASGSVIHLESSPSTITPQLTHSVTLTCSLNSTSGLAHPTSGLVGRGLDDVTYTPDDVAYITSIVVLLDSGVQVARITEHTPAVLLLNAEHNAQVTGNVTGTKAVRGYISITWTYPTQTEVGKYVCEVSGLTKEGRGVIYKTSTQIQTTEASISDLVSHIHQMKLDIATNEADLKTKDAEIANMTTALSTKDAEISDLKTQLSIWRDRSLHVENGSIVIPMFTDWSKTYTNPKFGHTMQYRDTTVRFTRAYSSLPSITWNVGLMEHSKDALLYAVELTNLSTVDFTLRVARYIGATYHFDRLVLEWTSIPRL